MSIAKQAVARIKSDTVSLLTVVFGVVLALFLGGCATGKTGAARPSALVPGTVAEVKGRLVSDWVAKGWRVESSTDVTVLFHQEAGFGQALGMGLIDGSTDAARRLQFTLVPEGSSVQVTADAWLLSHGWWGKETRADAHGSDAKLQQYLSNLASAR